MNIVAHNLLAMNANRQFGITNKKKAKSTEKLSSGYKINRAADDAAGLSISEKMRRQIRGLHKAEENIQDGISLCQVADGALNETHDILQRMNELAVKAGNDTNSQTDRAFIQTEIDALTEEIDRIAYDTTFNENIYPLLGGSTNIGDGSAVSGTIKVDEKGNEWVLPSQLRECECSFRVINSNGIAVVDDVSYTANQRGHYMSIGFDAEGQYNGWTQGRFGNMAGIPASLTPYTNVQDAKFNGIYSLTLSDLKVSTRGYVYYYNKRTNRNDFLAIRLDANLKPWNLFGQGVEYNGDRDGFISDSIDPFSGERVVFDYVRATRHQGNGQGVGSGGENGWSIGNQSGVWIHMSTEPGIGMFIDLVNATAKGIGIENLDMSSMENAGNAINSIKGAIETVSRYRNVFGSQQNRLEHAMRINANIAENTTDAESRIRDTDVAEEMLTFSNENILAQAGQSMLSQANQSQQNILSLLS